MTRREWKAGDAFWYTSSVSGRVKLLITHVHPNGAVAVWNVTARRKGSQSWIMRPREMTYTPTTDEDRLILVKLFVSQAAGVKV